MFSDRDGVKLDGLSVFWHETGYFKSMAKKLLYLLFLAVACSPSATTVKTDVQNTRPAWLSAKPQQSGYYVGIGQGIKDGTNNYIQAAKKSAFEDLISEIKVTVSSSSVLTQIDANKEFQEKYEQIIQTTAADDIQEFEQVDSWEDEKTYWVYYRLSRERYRQIKEEQKRNAITLGMDFFVKAKQADRAGEPVQALSFYYQGFRALEKYLAEPIRIDFEGKEILLTNEIIASMQFILEKIQLTANPSEIMLNRRMVQNDQTVLVTALDKASKKPVTDLPLRAAFEKGAGDVFPDYKTGQNGQIKVLLTKIGSRDIEQKIGVSVNMLSFAGDQPSPVYALVSSKMVTPKAVILMKVQRPLVYLSSIEKSLGTDKSNQQLTNRVKNYLANAGFEFTEQKDKAELWVDINSNSERGAQSGSIFITYVTAVIRVSTVKDSKEIYATTLDRVKGYSLDYERSSQEAYNKSLETLEKEKLPELLNAILQ
jgi:hypothetical protein